ncbi:MAG: hypothetical protein PHX10_08575 [Gallionellaceae bacterium]|nr:hypothetical protein [Gallionellaceae bacterium]
MARKLANGPKFKLVVLLGVFLLAWFGLAEMGFFMSEKSELKRLLGEGGAGLIDGAEVVAWGLDPDHKPDAYYALRGMDEGGFRRLATQAGLPVVPASALAEAIWKLPEGVKLPGWAAPSLPAGEGLQARGGMGDANVWLRWHAGKLYIVALRAS